MRYLFTLNFLLLLFTINAQTINIEYEVICNKNTAIQSTKSEYYYSLSNNKSIYFNDANKTDIFFNIDRSPEIIKSRDRIKLLKLDDNILGSVVQEYFYKDYELDTLLSDRYFSLQKKVIVIGEKINLFNWKIINNSDTIILNYHCQKAVTTFRGRNYEAFFSKELASYGGPWKFDGLPGLILSVRSTDNYFIINPVKLSIKAKSKKISNPYKNEKKIFSWNEYKDTFYKANLKLLKSEKAELLPGESVSIRITDTIEDLGFYKLSTDDIK